MKRVTRDRLSVLLFAILSLQICAAFAQTAKLAVILPLSGTYARSGELELKGIQMAVDEINAAGGIKALGGAKLEIAVKDAGGSVETAVSAARELLTGNPKPVGGIGAWLSSFTLGVSEVSERQKVPWLTVSSSDQVSARGFQFLYQTVAPSSVWADQALAYLNDLSKAQGCPIKKVAIVGDNTAAPVAFFNAVRKTVAPKLGWEIVQDTTWTPPLADATSIAQQLKTSKPDLILFGASNFPDASQVLSKNIEFGVKSNYVGNGSWLVMPEYAQAVGAKNLEGIFDISGAHPLKGFEQIVQRFMQRTKEPFMQQEGLAGYYQVWIFKEALEKAGSADPQKLNAAIKALDLRTGPAAAAVASGRVRFADNGRMVDATAVIAQWQAGIPVSVFPTQSAMAPAKFQCSR